MPDHGASLLRLSYANAHARLSEDARRAVAMAASGRGSDAANIVAQALLREQARLQSLRRFVNLDSDLHLGSQYVGELSAGLADAVKGMLQIVSRSWADPFVAAARANDARVPIRSRAVKGPLAPNGDWIVDRVGRQAAAIVIARVPNSGDVTYEIVNFVDGVRSVSEIRDAVSAEFEPVDLAAVAEYLEVLVKAGAISFKP
jgi:hypothetical protein